MSYYPCYADLNKVSLLHEELTEIESIDFVGLRNSTKGLHLSCHKHHCRDLNAYPNIYHRESIFLSNRNSKIWSNYQNDNSENLEG